MRLQACCKALRQQSIYVAGTWQLLLDTYSKVIQYMGGFDSDPRWIESELQRMKTLRSLGPKAACSSLKTSIDRFKGPEGMLYAIGGGQGGAECFGCVLHNNMPGKTPHPKYGAWIEKEIERVRVIRWMTWWCPGLRCVLPHVWGLAADELMELWFRALPPGPKLFLRPEWTVADYFNCMPTTRIKMQGGGYALLFRPTRSS